MPTAARSRLPALLVGTAATEHFSAPLVLKPSPHPTPHPHPGFGTILATAFIHMLLPAAQNLSSPCLPESWNERYEAWAYLFVVLSIVFMQVRPASRLPICMPGLPFQCRACGAGPLASTQPALACRCTCLPLHLPALACTRMPSRPVNPCAPAPPRS